MHVETMCILKSDFIISAHQDTPEGADCCDTWQYLMINIYHKDYVTSFG